MDPRSQASSCKPPRTLLYAHCQCFICNVHLLLFVTYCIESIHNHNLHVILGKEYHMPHGMVKCPTLLQPFWEMLGIQYGRISVTFSCNYYYYYYYYYWRQPGLIIKHLHHDYTLQPLTLKMEFSVEEISQLLDALSHFTCTFPLTARSLDLISFLFFLDLHTISRFLT